ncbi:DUF58 domain-containing protein [Planctomycetota bacterium]|nr:DUF58 domain-containing protein [Planctomycetota bacterium]
MKYSPTMLFQLLILALIPFSIMALLDDAMLFPLLISAVMLVLLAIVDVFGTPRADDLLLTRQHPTEVGVGDPFKMTVSISNHGGAAAGMLYDVIPEEIEGDRSPVPFKVLEDEACNIEFEFSSRDRGRLQFETATLACYGPLRLMRRIVRVESPATIAVIPGVEILRSNELILRAARDADAGISRSKGWGRGGEFESLAPYVPGDPPQAVDWKAYARSGQLAIKRFEPERRRHVMLACDAGRLMGTRVDGRRKIDIALASMAKVAAAALHRGDLVGLMIFDGEVRTLIPPRSGSGQLSKIVRASLNVEPVHTETAFTPAFVQMNHALGRRSLVILATDFDNEAQGWELQRNVAQISRKHVAIVTAMRDPKYYDVLRRPSENLEQAYESLASLTLLEERENIVNRIHSMGVHIIDSEPANLDGPLLNLYGRVVGAGL